MGITESLWLIICVSFILSLISTLIFLTLIEKYTITLYEKCRNGRVLTPFKAEGYTGETKFRVLKNRGSLKRGDIVTVAYDDGKTRIYFKKEDGRLGWFWLPNMTPEGYEEDLEVYEEVYEEPTKKLTPFEKAGYTRNTQFRVLRDMWYFNKGDIVTLHKDDGTDCPSFKTEDGWQDLCWLPNTVDVTECGELEVYEEVYEGPTKKLTPFEKAGYTKDTKFRVLEDYWGLKVGDTVKLWEDDGSPAPWFKTVDSRKGWLFLPYMVPEGYREQLEVYEESKEEVQ